MGTGLRLGEELRSGEGESRSLRRDEHRRPVLRRDFRVEELCFSRNGGGARRRLIGAVARAGERESPSELAGHFCTYQPALSFRRNSARTSFGNASTTASLSVFLPIKLSRPSEPTYAHGNTEANKPVSPQFSHQCAGCSCRPPALHVRYQLTGRPLVTID